MSLKLSLNFGKQSMNQGVLDILSNGLQEDLGRDVSMISLKECLTKLANGYKLPYKAANYLLTSVLSALAPEDGDTTEEMADHDLPGTQTETRSLEQDDGQTDEDTQDAIQSTSATTLPKPARKSSTTQNSNTLQKKKKELCRFYARGHCTRKKECRFDHPNICQKFHKFGSLSSDPKGCDGKCSAFHPNACKSSLKNKTCDWDDCRFYHLKGTKRTPSQTHDQSSNRNRNRNANNQKDWNDKSNTHTNTNRKRNEGTNPNYNRHNNTNQNQGNSNSRNPNAANKPEQVFQKDQPELVTMIQEIMKRLADMETRQSMVPHLVTSGRQIAPLLSPAVPQPGTQTQYQWASQGPWTQSQM